MSWAPQALEMMARNPTPKAVMEELTSHPTVLVAPTAAVACVPRAPTMAVSMYCTADWLICSSIVGQARVKITRTMARDSLFCCIISTFLLQMPDFRISSIIARSFGICKPLFSISITLQIV